MEDKDVIEVTMVDYQASGFGKVTVTKKVTFANGGDFVDLIAQDDTFYVNLFTDAAGNILDDFGDTLNCLKNVAGSLSLCENQRLRALGYHRINFLRHRYFMLYRIEENTVFIDDIFHELQDYENKMK